MSWMNFNDAEEQTSGDLIPHRTKAKVRLKIQPGGHDEPEKGWTDGMATRSDNTGAVYLSGEFTVIGGKYNKRKVWSLIGLESPRGPKWGQMGRTFIRAALESAHGIKPSDNSEKAMAARRINSLADLDGLEFVAQIDVEKAPEGSEYDDKNKIQNVVPVTDRQYEALMSGQGVSEDSAPATRESAPAAKMPAWAS